jgi:hypothetical protein
MSSKRQPSKQRRQSQNQWQRAALAAGGEAAALEYPSVAEPAATSGGADPTTTSSGSLFSRLRGTSATGRAVRTGNADGLPPGHRAALTALIAAIAGAIVGSIMFPVPVDRAGDPLVGREAVVAEWMVTADDAVQGQPDPTPAEVVESIDDWSPGGTEPYIQAFFPVSLAVLLPVIGAAIGFRAVSNRASAKTVNRTMYVTLFGTLLTSQLLLVFLPAVISLGVAAFQVRRAEMAAAADAEPAVPGGGDVIDVEAVEVDEVDTDTDTGAAADDDLDEPDEIDDEVDEDEIDDDEFEAGPAPEPQSVLGRLRRPSR